MSKARGQLVTVAVEPWPKNNYAEKKLASGNGTRNTQNQSWHTADDVTVVRRNTTSQKYQLREMTRRVWCRFDWSIKVKRERASFR